MSRRTRRRRGSVLLEAAVACCFLLLPLVLGIIQFGRFYNASNVLSQVSREGSRFAAVYGLDPTKDDNYIKDHMIVAGANSDLTIAREDISISPARAARVQYQPITVTVQYNLNNKRIKGIGFWNAGIATRSSVSMLEGNVN